MTEDDKLDLVYGRTVALEMLLRGLYAKWAMEAPDPEASIERLIGGILTSMREVDSPKSEVQERVWYWAENALSDFQRNVSIRVKGNLSEG